MNSESRCFPSDGHVKTIGSASIRILANLYAAQKASREMSGGVLRYASLHPDVEARLYGLGTAYPTLAEFRAWKPDGVIVGANDETTVHLIERIGCRAAVFVNVEPPRDTTLRCGSVFCDNGAVAAAAAGLFARKNLRHCAFVGARTNDPWSAERERAMRECAERQSCTFAAFSPPRAAHANLRRDLAALARWVADLPKPCGILAARDLRAKDVLDACREASVPVPEHVMVLGVDDEEFICGQTVPTLSSVLPDFESGGYLAAEMLVSLLAGGPRRLQRRTFGVRGIIERISTCDPNEAGRMVSRAEEFIRRNAATADLSVPAVAKASGASVRLLQKNFKAITGTTVCEAIQTARLERVCSLLAQTTTPIGRIAELCGFGSDAYLKKLFRSRLGCTMRDYRHREAPFLSPQ